MMKMIFKATLAAGTLLSATMLANADFDAETEKKFDAVLAGKHRSEGNAVRDKYRHPKETLEFFGVQPDMTVVEIWPGSYYTEILAPFLREDGKYVAAVSSSVNGSARARRGMAGYLTSLVEKDDVLGKTHVSEFTYPDSLTTVPAGTADMVLTFRNVHNWMGVKAEYGILAAAFKALKPGGILGVVEHRLDGGEGVEDGQNARRGYVREGYVIEVARSFGFEVVDASDINANPKDNKNHPRGVWTLPPRFALGDQDKEKYTEIGESDRFTLKFKKPEQTQ